MKEKGFDTLIVACPGNIHYLTGFDGWGYYMPMFVIMTQDPVTEPEPVLIARGMDAAAGSFATYLPLNRCFAYEDHLVDNEVEHPMHAVCDFLVQQGWEKGTIALEMASDFCTARHLEVAQQELPGVKLVNDKRLVNWIRLVKSEAELAKVREAAVIADKAFQAALDKLNKDPFSRGCDVIGEVTRAQICGTPDYGGTFTAIVPMTSAGRDSDAGHMNWSSDPYLRLKPDGSLPETDVGQGSAIVMEFAGSRNHYHCPIARTLMLGNPSEDYLRFIDCSYRGIEAMLSMAKPGVTMEELYHAYQNTLLAEGYSKASRVGYSFGIGFSPDWGEKTISVRPGDKTELLPGMCLHLIAGAGDGYTFLTSEAIIITEGKPELLHDPRRRKLHVQRIPSLDAESSEGEGCFEMEVDHHCTTRERYYPRKTAPMVIQPPPVPLHPSAASNLAVKPARDRVPRVESVEDIMDMHGMLQDTESFTFAARDLGP